MNKTKAIAETKKTILVMRKEYPNFPDIYDGEEYLIQQIMASYLVSRRTAKEYIVAALGQIGTNLNSDIDAFVA